MKNIKARMIIFFPSMCLTEFVLVLVVSLRCTGVLNLGMYGCANKGQNTFTDFIFVEYVLNKPHCHFLPFIGT